MKTKTVRWRSWVLVGSVAALVSAGGAGACSGKFELDCPEGSVQVGGGDVDDVCVPVAGMGGGGGVAGEGGGGSGGGAASGGSANAGSGPVAGTGGAPSMGSGGAGGAPLDEACNTPDAKRCSGGAQRICTGGGTWSTPQPCDIACDAAGEACVLPVQLAAGSGHMCALLSDGSVRCWGHGTNGQLGNGKKANSATPVPVAGLSGASSIVAGRDFSCVSRPRGTSVDVACWGKSDLGAAAVHDSPIIVETIQAQEKFCVSDTFVCVTKLGDVMCRGQNDDGQLGNNTTSDSPFFVTTADFPDFPSKFSAFASAACAVTTSNTITCWGDGLFGQGGTGLPGQDLLVPTEVANVSGARDVSVSFNHSCAVLLDGRVQCWGRNDAGQLGSGTDTFDIDGATFVADLAGVARVSNGGSFSCAAKNDRTLWCWGSNGSGELGSSCTDILCVTPINNYPHVPFPVKVPLDQVVDVAASTGRFACAITTGGKVYCWGSNADGQLGTGTGESYTPVPTAIRWKLRERKPTLTLVAIRRRRRRRGSVADARLRRRALPPGERSWRADVG